MGRMKEKFLNNLENEVELYSWRKDGDDRETEHRSNRKGRRRTKIVIHKTGVVASPELTQAVAWSKSSNPYESEGVE